MQFFPFLFLIFNRFGKIFVKLRRTAKRQYFITNDKKYITLRGTRKLFCRGVAKFKKRHLLHSCHLVSQQFSASDKIIIFNQIYDPYFCPKFLVKTKTKVKAFIFNRSDIFVEFLRL